LCNSDPDDGALCLLIYRLDAYNTDTSNQFFHVSANDVPYSITIQKPGKAVGPDGIALEAIMYAGNKLAIHICFIFNLLIRLLTKETFVSDLIWAC
jgi:hypothetical protein